MTQEEKGVPFLNRGVTILNLLFTAVGSAIVVGSMIFSTWISIHDELNTLKFQVSAFGNTAVAEKTQDTRIEALEFIEKESISDRGAIHKAMDDFEASSVADRRDLRDRIIRLEGRK